MSKIIRKLVLTENQFERLSNIFDNAGQVVFGIAVLSPIVSGFDRINLIVILSSLILTFSLWVFSIKLAEKE